jgi:hypothetical protein
MAPTLTREAKAGKHCLKIGDYGYFYGFYAMLLRLAMSGFPEIAAVLPSRDRLGQAAEACLK